MDQELRRHVERLLEERTRREPVTGCLLWTGARLHAGYPVISYRGRRGLTVHRLVYECFHGPIKAGLFVCHHCDVRHCVEGTHLFVGTPKDNTHDAMNKARLDLHGLTSHGEAHHNVKITEEIVREIRRRMDGAPYGTQRRLARELGITEANVSLIVKRKAWRHVE
jgi:hypothetical protein